MMKITTASLFACLASAFLCPVTAFTTTTLLSPISQHPPHTSLSYSVHDEDKPIQCFLIQTDDDKDVVLTPQIVCTPNPEEYAWFNGLDKDQLVPTDGIHDEALQCVEYESPRGVPEWECESAFQ